MDRPASKKGDGMTSKDVESLVVLVQINGKVYQLSTSDENQNRFLDFIDVCEGGVEVIDKPLDGLSIEKGE